MHFLDHLAGFLESKAGIEPGDRLLVAFSGGPDSTALLWGLQQIAPRLRFDLRAAHLDHGIDNESGARADQALALARRIGVPCRSEHRAVSGAGGTEAAARRVRYAFLEDERRRCGARFVVTAHHRDDQAETVLLRLLHGSGIDGLAAIQPARGSLLRPLLELSRAALDDALGHAGLITVQDPTNLDLSIARNRIRHQVLPKLENESPDLRPRLARLAERSLRARGRVDSRLESLLRPVSTIDGLRVRRDVVETLSQPLVEATVRFLHRRTGSEYPPSSRAQKELWRQLSQGHAIGCDCGRGWSFRSRNGWLELARNRPKAADFTYTLTVPGSIELVELGLRIYVIPSRVSPWMFRSFPQRAGLALPLRPGERVTVRNRRPGDRVQPFGWERQCRVKELLINRNVPRERRSRLPFLCHAGEIAWIPGVTISETTRIASQRRVWVAGIERV